MADADDDGRLSPGEAAKLAEQLIRDADKDKKGSIDVKAFEQIINLKFGPPPGFGPGPGPGPGGPPPGTFGPGMFLAAPILKAADTDKDGRLSPAEASKAAEGFVKEVDAAGKGSIDVDTLAAAMNRRIGPPPGFGPGGPGGPMGQERKLVDRFDKDEDGRLNQPERRAAREFLKKDRASGGGRGPFPFPGPGPRPGGPPPGFGFGARNEEKPRPGPRISPADVKTFPDQPLYEPHLLRTLFLEFEDKDWEAEMADFYRTDVEVPATLLVDGKTYPGVGVHFRGLSSYFTVREGRKRSLNLSLDFTNPDQRLHGYKTLNLLNSHEDPTFLHTILYSRIARDYIPAPKANFVRLVINGESWGVYVNAQQFDKKFLTENFPNDKGKGARWKVPGSPGGGGGLDYLGEDASAYKSRYQIKTKDDPKDWKALIALCRTLGETPLDRLEEALKPILDVEGVLWFLALENTLINNDGYWIRASDYSIYRDSRGRFHLIPHDANETFQPAMGPGFGPPGFPGGPGFGRGRRGRGGPGAAAKAGPGAGFGPGPGLGPRPPAADLDPLIGLDDPRKPLRSRLLAVPALRQRYLDHVRTIAEDWLDWNKLGPIVARYRSLIAEEIKADTRKLVSYEEFEKAVADSAAAAEAGPAHGRPELSLRAFADQRRKFLLDHPAIRRREP